MDVVFDGIRTFFLVTVNTGIVRVRVDLPTLLW